MSDKKEEKQPIELGELHKQEKRLILAIRNKYQFGEVSIVTRHGLPIRLKLTERFEDLT